MNGIAMIKLDCVGLKYNEKKVFSGLSLEILRGEKVVVLGRSGLGKSSLFSLILGYVQPNCGNVFFCGVCIDEKTVWDVRKRVSFIDQDVSVGGGTVAEWLAFVSGLRVNSSLDFGNNQVRELFELFELGHDLLDKDVSELSGGERQRIAIVVSALLGREVFLLDEVTSALDKHLKEKVTGFFLKEAGWTVVVISHDAVWLDNPAVKVFDLEAEKWTP